MAKYRPDEKLKRNVNTGQKGQYWRVGKSHNSSQDLLKTEPDSGTPTSVHLPPKNPALLGPIAPESAQSCYSWQSSQYGPVESAPVHNND